MRLNTGLAKKPPECLEYILVHEPAHLLERTHNARFVGLMDLYLPHWQHLRRQLRQLPVRHEDWAYRIRGIPARRACAEAARPRCPRR
ncbi:YgjP-like metallopeptidase domain-containing protein [Pelomonas aquatica]|uniref:YgjP-like metallopeptidase domain-containing protein n=1 Tax=Pelomonas aquatica TaxID=431058 RepID=UPI00227BB233|nr:YgjP-like metallopeptidase domain-containing protein [Pelomonas aquatica]MCY4753034.1 DUF45 domain-containing protein [Pelomonas aquatica]